MPFHLLETVAVCSPLSSLVRFEAQRCCTSTNVQTCIGTIYYFDLTFITVKYLLTCIVLRIVSWFNLKTIRYLASRFGDIAWILHTRAARTTRKNLELCYPHLPRSERMQLARESMRQTACIFFEIAMLWYWPRTRIRKLSLEIQYGVDVDSLLSKGGYASYRATLRKLGIRHHCDW